MPDPHPLDRPIWSALNSGWAAYAQGDARALRLDPDYGPFAAAADLSDASIAALEELAPVAGELWIVEAGALPVPRRTRMLREARLAQMVMESFRDGREMAFETLSEADATEIRALAELTKPGPFAVHTNRLGDFIGIRHEGKLVAMAGERMRIDDYSEVSGVCTHPDHRGQGYAGVLIRAVARRILDRGKTPFLHSYADNAGAIALYEGIGFRTRATINVLVLTRDPE